MAEPQINPVLESVLNLVARDCSALADPWWVFGSAGMALVGVPGLAPPDVDLIVSERDAATLVAAWKAAPVAAAPSPLFRSKVFAKARVAALPIEIMAGFEAFSAGSWAPVGPACALLRCRVMLPGPPMYLPLVSLAYDHSPPCT